MNSVLVASYVVLWILVLVLSAAVFGLYHHFGQMYIVSREGRQKQGPDLDRRLKRMPARDIRGIAVELPYAGVRQLVVFSTTDCKLCAHLRPDLARFAAAHSDLETVVICGGDSEAVRAWADGLSEVARVVADPTGRLAAAYRVGLTPFVVAIDETGTVISKGIVNDTQSLEWVARGGASELALLEQEA